MAERKRNKEIHFYVTEEERKLIRRKMIEYSGSVVKTKI